MSAERGLQLGWIERLEQAAQGIDCRGAAEAGAEGGIEMLAMHGDEGPHAAVGGGAGQDRQYREQQQVGEAVALALAAAWVGDLLQGGEQAGERHHGGLRGKGMALNSPDPPPIPPSKPRPHEQLGLRTEQPWLKWAGATYLVWLGVRMWREARHLLAVTAEPAGQLPAKAFLVTLLNPKSLLFFVAFMPHFMQPNLPVAPQLLLMGATFLVLSGCNAAAYAMLSGGLARVLDAAARRGVHRMGAVLLMGMGVLTATLRRA
jgi:hypothetical protein